MDLDGRSGEVDYEPEQEKDYQERRSLEDTGQRVEDGTEPLVIQGHQRRIVPVVNNMKVRVHFYRRRRIA